MFKTFCNLLQIIYINTPTSIYDRSHRLQETVFIYLNFNQAKSIFVFYQKLSIEIWQIDLKLGQNKSQFYNYRGQTI